MSEPSSLEARPPKPDPAVLENRWLHKVFIFFTTFDRASPSINWLRYLLILGVSYGLWRFAVPKRALAITAILAVVTLLDIVLLWQLPRRKISFGRVPSQFAVMVIPRLGVTFLALPLSLWQPNLGLGVIAGLQLLGTIIYLWAMVVEPGQLATHAEHCAAMR